MTGLLFDLINGDTDEDNLVGLYDLNTVLTNFNSAGDGDLDESGCVDLHDLNIVFSALSSPGDD